MAQPRAPRTAAKLLGVLTLALFALLAFELAAQVYARTVVFPGFDRTQADPRHYYQPSANPVLAYELRPDNDVDTEKRRLRVNRWGIRESSDAVDQNVRRAAILGDSVVFGVTHDQALTLSARVEKELDPAGGHLRVYNFGLGGLNMREISEYLEVNNAIYDVSDVVYLLNPNDYAPRNTVYEGADNGLYRMYERPVFMTPWFVRKAIYRINKGGPASVRWYEWMFAGNETWGQEALLRMKAYAEEREIGFSVVLLPSIHAFSEDGTYTLADINQRIASFLEDQNILYIDARFSFQDDPQQYLDPTDHLHVAGAERMASVLARALMLGDPELSRLGR
ncbi:MAG: hypothetical protein VX546_04270 [Myxococcota bacterium]|nr:hypothetical protein [Myxococcota bacterium]